jgi:predicted DNA binding CopG/RHH family protein
MLDNFVIDAYRQLAEQEGIGYQTLINRRLRESLESKPLDEEILRRVVREELGAYDP